MSKGDSSSVTEALKELPDLVGSLFCGGGTGRRRHRAHSDGSIRAADRDRASSLRRYLDDAEPRPSGDGDPEAWEAHPWAVAFDGGDGAPPMKRAASSDFDTDSDDDFADLPAMVESAMRKHADGKVHLPASSIATRLGALQLPGSRASRDAGSAVVGEGPDDVVSVKPGAPGTPARGRANTAPAANTPPRSAREAADIGSPRSPPPQAKRTLPTAGAGNRYLSEPSVL